MAKKKRSELLQFKYKDLTKKQKERFGSKSKFKESKAKRKERQAGKTVGTSQSIYDLMIPKSGNQVRFPGLNGQQMGPYKDGLGIKNMGTKPSHVDPERTPEKPEVGQAPRESQRLEGENYADHLAGLFEEMQGKTDLSFEQFKERMRDPSYRARVQGIRFADRGTGGMTQRQLARRGTKGVFGRTGLRISSLNI